MDADVVIVGAGSAGCAAAHRLARTPGMRVLVVEAGPDYGQPESWPGELLDARRLPQTHDWGFEEERDDGSVRREPRARVAGGCSAHNQCAALWPLPDDCERWAEVTGDDGWRHRNLRPLADELEDALGGDPDCRGRGGVLPTRAYAHDELATWQRAFLDTAVAAGFPPLADLSSPEPVDGVAPFQVNVRDGMRWNAALAFLRPPPTGGALRVLDRTRADRLVLERGRCVAVVCRSSGGDLALRATHILLTGGVYGSPMLLLRSGVGPAQHLRALGIPVAVDLPAVGRNLHDHPGVAVTFRPTREGRAALDRDLAGGRFHQSQVALRAGGGVLHVLPYHAARGGGWSFELLAFAMRPASRGTVDLRTRDPDGRPRIRFRYASDRDGRDLAALRDGIRLALRLAACGPLAELAGAEDTATDDAGLAAAIGGYGHAVGTCAMGSVTDARGRVAGLDNVRVADASLVPVIPRQNTNLTAILVGWRVAGLLAGEVAGAN